jgi:ribosomal protein S18 acetylase RimI-like enzyme
MKRFDVKYEISPTVTNDELNRLLVDAWDEHAARDFMPVLSQSLLYVCAYHETGLIGYVIVAWDGARHAFILDTTVDKDFRRRGIGIELIRQATEAARKRGVDWLHVDYEPHLKDFYRKCGFRDTAAGLINLRG